MFQRSSGVLLHISSLPGEYGIGGFGKEARAFVQQLSEAGCTYWQTLPFGTTDPYNSPYKSYSAFAGNPYFIDLETLAEKGLLTQEELEQNKYPVAYAAAYDWLNETRMDILRRAYRRTGAEEREAVKAFREENRHWLPDYALYMALRGQLGGDWYDWQNEALRLHEEGAVAFAQEVLREDIGFYEFLQYEFFAQWAALKQYANRLGVRVLGDMPIYVSLESADVWGNRRLFDLEEDGSPRCVAGVPPDYFAQDGQLWGNPLYNWEAMKQENYSWWIARLGSAFTLYDAVRIDHFRGFASYWAVPASAATARDGQWVKGPGMELFHAIFQAFDQPDIIAEDLGNIDGDVVQLLHDTGLPGMRVMQFGFLSDDDNMHLPHQFPENCIAYTGTHDNDTTLGWLWEAQPHQRDCALAYCQFAGGDWQTGGVDSQSCAAFIKTLWQSRAMVAIVPVQDLCGFGTDTRMNRPGVQDGNWAFRITKENLEHIRWDRVREWNQECGRMRQ